MDGKPWVLSLTALLAACGGDVCDASAIADAFAAGDESVRIGACEVVGDVDVPQGRALIGEAGARIVGRVTLGNDAAMSALSVVSSADVGIRLGEGASLADVTVDASDGIAVGAEDANGIAMSRVTITADAARYGVAFVRGGGTLEDVTATGFERAGAVFVDSTVDWRGGASNDNLGLGVLVEGGTSTFEDVEILGTRQGTGLLPSFGAVFTNGAAVGTRNVSLRDNEGYGLLHHTGTGNHTDVDARNNGDAAIWVQNANGVEISGTIADNQFGGVVVVDSTQVDIHDATIDRTTKVLRVLEETGAVEVGDGIQLVRSADGTTIRNVELTNNERVGVLVELDGGTLDPGLFENVTITGDGTSYGVIAQNGQTAMNWDNGVALNGAAMADGLVTLPSVEAVGPCERPAASGGNEGLAGL